MKKLIISSAILKVALAKLGQAINAKSTLLILTNLFCKVTPGQIELIATNLEITIFYRLECESKESFEFLIPFEEFNRIVAFYKDCPLIIESGKVIKIKGNDDVFDIKMGEKIETFPKLQELPKKNGFEISTDILHCLHTALTTTGKSDGNPIFANVLVDLSDGKITVASTNGSHVVFSKEFESENKEVQELLLSQKVIKVLEGSEKVNIVYHQKAIGFVTEKITIINTRTEQKYVNFRAIFPQDWPANLTIEKTVLLEALSKCSVVSDMLHKASVSFESKKDIRFTAEDEILNVNVSVPGVYTGKVKETAVNTEMLAKLLHQIEHDEIELAIHDSKRAIILTLKEDPGYKALLMPIAV